MLKIQCITFDCEKPAVPAKFWSEALGWSITISNDEEVVVENPSGEIYWDVLKNRVQEHAQFAKFIGLVDLRKSSLNKDAGLIGAALAYLDR